MSNLDWLRDWSDQYEASTEADKAASQLKREEKFRRKQLKSHGFGFVQPKPELIYSDWPAKTTYSVKRNYDPTLYGRPEGSEWPKTDEDAQKG